MTVHAPSRPGPGPVSPFGVEALEGAAEEERVVLVDLEVGAAAEADGVGGDVGDLGGMAVDAASAEGERGGGGGRNRGRVNDERDGNVAARVAEREVVGERVDEAGGDSDIEETNFEARRMGEGRESRQRRGFGNDRVFLLLLIHVRIQ